MPRRHLRHGAGQEVQPEHGVAGGRAVVEMRHPDRSGIDLAQSLEDREHGQVDPDPRSGIDERHVRQRRAGRRIRAARRRSDQDRPHDLQVPHGRQHRERLPRGDLPADDRRRPDADLQQALLHGHARTRDRARAPLPAIAVAGDVRHRSLQEGQRQLRPPGGRLRAQAAGADGARQDPARGLLRALRRRGVCDRAAGDRRRERVAVRGEDPADRREDRVQVREHAHPGHDLDGRRRRWKASRPSRRRSSSARTNASTKPRPAAATASAPSAATIRPLARRACAPVLIYAK